MADKVSIPPVLSLPRPPKADEDFAEWAKNLTESLQKSYIPQADRIENMIMIDDGLRRRPEPIGSRRLFFDRSTGVFYIDSETGGGVEAGLADWVPLNEITIAGPSGGGDGGTDPVDPGALVQTTYETVDAPGTALWDTEVYDGNDYFDFDTPINRDHFTIPSDGDYQISWSVVVDKILPGEDLIINILVNGGSHELAPGRYFYNSTAGDATQIPLSQSIQLDLREGDEISLNIICRQDNYPSYSFNVILNSAGTPGEFKIEPIVLNTSAVSSSIVTSSVTRAPAPSSSTVHHGGTFGLDDDDHEQYLLASDATDRTTFAANWADLTDAGATTLHKHDHGGQDGLSDDDHPAYLLASDATDRATFAANWTDLTDAGDTILHGHDVTGLTNWPTIDYSYVSGNDAGTDVSAAELEELTDGSDTTLHGHDVTGLTNWPTIDYSYVSGNDAGTDVSAAELEELTDGSDTSLHNHDGLYYTDDEVDTLLTGYLPLTAGSTKPLTGDLYLDGATNPAIFLRENADATDYTIITDTGSSMSIERHDAGATAINITPANADRASNCYINLFNKSSFDGGGGSGALRIYNGLVGSSNLVQHILYIDGGNAELCKQGGTLTVGDTASNGVLIDPVNGVYLYGSAMSWDDLRVAADTTKLAGSKDPDYTVFKTNGAGSQGVFTYWFDDSLEEEVYFSIQMPHTWAEGTDIEPHVHWVAATTAGGAGTDVCWGLEYTWANINGTFGNTTIIYADEQTNGATETITAGKHYLTDFAAISGTGKTLSSMLICRLFRDAGGTGGTDDLAGDAGLLEFDIHYQINSLGSDDEYTKGP